MSAALELHPQDMDADLVLACLRRYREHLDIPQKVSRPDAMNAVRIGDGMTGDDLVAFALRDPISTALRKCVRDVAWRTFVDGGAGALVGLVARVVAAVTECERDWAAATLSKWLVGVGG